MSGNIIPGCGPGPALQDSYTFREAFPPCRVLQGLAEIHSSNGPVGHEPVGDI